MRHQLLVVPVHLQYVLGDGEQELPLHAFGEVQRDVPLGDHLFIAAALLDAAVVVPVLEEEDAPVLDGLQLDESEEWLLLDGLQHKGDEVLGGVHCRTLGVDDELVEVGEDHIAAQFFQTIQELEEVLLHQLVDQTVEQRVVQLRLSWR